MADPILLLSIPLEIWAFILAIFGILFVLLKDFILPLFLVPRLIFEYSDSSPYRREDVIINGELDHKGTFLRFLVKNKGYKSAINCRCQILEVLKNGKKYGDYQGFPLRWASRPESVINQASGERLNIARGESEFIDIAATSNKNPYIYLQKYHNVSIGIKEVIEYGRYNLILIFSGDNFKPYKLKFEINRKNSKDPKNISLKLIKS